MGALEELIHYCNEKNPIGALLLAGEWGCGKTYLIENELTKALENTHVIVKVSLWRNRCRCAAEYDPAEMV